MFDERFFEVPCFRLSMPVMGADLKKLGPTAAGKPGFVDVKVPASDLKSSRLLLSHGFRKICTQIQLRRDLAARTSVSSPARVKCKLRFSKSQIKQHAANFVASR